MLSDDLFSSQFEAMEDSLYRVSYSILRNHADAQDAIQEGLLKAWNARARCMLHTFRPWVMKIVINECRNIQRRRMREVPVERLPETEAYLAGDSLELRDALDKLNETLRTPLLLELMEGMSGKEIAKALSISHVAVRNRLFRARKELRKLLGEEVIQG